MVPINFLKEKPHVVFVPYPAQGHVTPMMQLGKLLHARGFHITFVNTEFNHRRWLRSKGPDALNGLEAFRFETIPDGLPPSDKDAMQDVPALCESTKKNCLLPLVDLITRKLNSSPDIPQVTCIISDGVMSFGLEAGKILGIPVVQFWTASACGFMGFLQFHELINRGLVPLKDETFLSNGFLDTKIDWIPGMRNMRLKDLPSYIRTTDPNDVMLNYMGEESQNCLNASAIIFNTFDELEYKVLNAISSKFPHIYTIGSLSLLSDQHLPEGEIKSLQSSLWKEDFQCMLWLDKQIPSSVIYVNFGSIAVMTEQLLKEFAWGLANSRHKFLWIIRPDILKGDSVILPQEFISEIRDRGFLANWCPQDLVLSHPSVGGFLTHCGWNSTLESICGGVPLLCWPYFAEQHTNCRYANKEWGIGIEIDNNVKREEIEGLVKELMEGEEEGKKMRENALKWKEKAKEATEIGGSSYVNFERLIEEVLYPKDLPCCSSNIEYQVKGKK